MFISKPLICDPTIAYYLRAPLCFAHFLTRKTNNCIFAFFFVQIYRMLYSNGENFTFFSHGSLFFGIKLCLNKKNGKPFVGAGECFTRPYKSISRGRPWIHPPLQIFFHISFGYSFKSAIILNNVRKS